MVSGEMSSGSMVRILLALSDEMEPGHCLALSVRVNAERGFMRGMEGWRWGELPWLEMAGNRWAIE